MTKKTIRTKVEYFDEYALNGPVSAAIEKLQEFAAKHGDDAELELYVGGDDGYSDFGLFKTREETDSEYTSRLGREKQQALSRENYERTEYARLKAKYG